MVDKTRRKIQGKVEILSAPYDSEWVWKGTMYHRKGEEFDKEKQKFWVPDLRFLKFVRQRIESSEARVWLRDKSNGF